MADRVRVCCIGCGMMATNKHYPSLAAMEDVELVALSELDPDRLAKGQETFGFARTYADYQEMVAKEEPDAVYALMPPQHIFPVLQHLLSHGHNTFSEKPPALTTFQAEVLAGIIAREGNLTMVGYQRKWVPLVRRLRELVEARGPVDHVVATFHKHGAKSLYYGGAIDILTCDASHMLDCLLWLMGEPIAVSSTVRNSTVDGNCKYNALLTFAQGRTAFFSAHWNSGRRALDLEIHGQGCVARTDVETTGTYFDADHPEGLVLHAADVAGDEADLHVGGFFAQSRHFMDCVKAGEQPVGSFPEALRTMQVVDRIYAAAQP